MAPTYVLPVEGDPFRGEDPEASAFADRPGVEPNVSYGLRSYLPSDHMLEPVTRPLRAARDSLMEGVDLAKQAGVGRSLLALHLAPYKAAANLAQEGLATAGRWLGASQQIDGAKATDEIVAPRGTEDYEYNPNRVLPHDMLAPLGLAGMGSPVGSLASNALRRVPGQAAEAAAERPFLERMRTTVQQMQDTGAAKSDINAAVADLRRAEMGITREQARKIKAQYGEMMDRMGAEQTDGRTARSARLSDPAYPETFWAAWDKHAGHMQSVADELGLSVSRVSDYSKQITRPSPQSMEAAAAESMRNAGEGRQSQAYQQAQQEGRRKRVLVPRSPSEQERLSQELRLREDRRKRGLLGESGVPLPLPGDDDHRIYLTPIDHDPFPQP